MRVQTVEVAAGMVIITLMTTRENELEPRLGRPPADQAPKLKGVRSAVRQATREPRSSGPAPRQPSVRAHFAKGSAVRARPTSAASRRVVVKVRYAANGGGRAAPLRAHVAYLSREGSQHGRQPQFGADLTPDDPTRSVDYLTREETGGSVRFAFYDRASDTVDAKAITAGWSEDPRHFRMIVSAEDGAALGDLRPFIREVMEGLEARLATKLEWLAVDHHDTDNPHSHIVLRGVRDDGRDLIIPREYVQHGFREAARAEATERLGARSREDAKDALQREALAHRPTRLDALIEAQLDKDGRVKIAKLEAPNRTPDWTNALKARAHELRRLELASEVSRNHLAFQPGWRDALKAMELHLDIRKSLMRERAAETPGNKPTKSPLPFRLGF